MLAATSGSIIKIARAESAPVWGLLADLHYDRTQADPLRLEVLEASMGWAAKTFKEQGVRTLMVLGDVLNTREVCWFVN
jgi:hypothetical protein